MHALLFKEAIECPQISPYVECHIENHLMLIIETNRLLLVICCFLRVIKKYKYFSSRLISFIYSYLMNPIVINPFLHIWKIIFA